MADNYTVLGSFPTVQVVSPQSVVDVVRIGFRTIPSGIIAYANAPNRNLVGIAPGDVDGIASVFIAPLATGIERVMGLGFVVAGSHQEDVAPSGLLTDWMVFTVEYAPAGPGALDVLQQDVRIAIFSLDEPSFFSALVLDPLNKAYAGLQALAAA